MYYWDYESLFLFLLLGYLGVYLLLKSKILEKKWDRPNQIFNRYNILWVMVWAFFSAIRLVDSSGIGGVDAPAYREYFEVINEQNVHLLTYQYLHYDILFKYICEFVRIFTSNYHIFFFIIYAIIAFGIVYFVNTFSSLKGSFAPYIVLFYLYLLGHNTIRTHLAIALILLGIALIWKRKNKMGIAIVIASIFIQKTSALYVMVLPFYYLLKKRNLNIKKVLILTLMSAGAGLFVQHMLISTVSMSIDLGGAYADYAMHNVGVSFFENFWKIAFPQLLLAFFLIIFNKQIRKEMVQSDIINNSRINMIWMLCMFDIILIPTTFILNFWRGYEYFLVVRLVMWSEIIKIIKKRMASDFTTRTTIDIFSYVMFLIWFIFRLYNTYELSGLMPYVVGF